jgi:ADP-ribose pyrophosphatase YjhB (NUDIX family)
MKRIRAVAITIKNDELLVMFRREGEHEYFVFPGGRVEEDESIKDAVLREIKEETSIDVSIEKLLYHQLYDDDTEHYFYLCHFMQGEPKLDDASNEKAENSEHNFYDPRWVKFNTVDKLLLYPLEIRDLLIEDYKNNFINCPKIMHIKMAELRHAL